MTTRCHWTTSPNRVSSAVTPATGRLDGTPAVPAYLRIRGGHPGGAAEAGRGSGRAQREAVPVKTGSVPKHPPKVPPTPAAAPPQDRRSRRTTRPAREPGRTGLSLRGESPPHFRMATAPGTDAYRDRPGRCPRHSRPTLPGWAAGVRMSVGCGSSAAVGPGVAPARDSQAGSPRDCRTTAAVNPGSRGKHCLTVPGMGNYCLLTRKAL
jgi:hypothetical protein